MSAESNARSHAEAFRWWRGAPDLTEVEAERRDLEALRDGCVELLAEIENREDIMTDNDRAERLEAIASRMFPNGKHRPDMSEEEMAAKAEDIVAQVMRKREARLE